MIDLVQALDYVPASTLDYHEWIEVGMGIKDAGYDVSVWDDWSRFRSMAPRGSQLMSINAFIAQGHGRSTDGSSNPYADGWEVTDASL